MSYAWDITIPANRLADTPVEQILPLHPGVITKIEVKFARGCHGMVQVRLFQGRFQLFPLSRDEWVTGDDEAIPFPMYYELPQEPAELLFVGCSPGTEYSHVITVRISILPKIAASAIPLIELFAKFLARLGIR